MSLNNIYPSEKTVVIINSARRLKFLLEYNDLYSRYFVSLIRLEKDSFTSEQIEIFNKQQCCLPILNRIVEVYELYRENRFAPKLTEKFWRNRECLKEQISLFFNSQADLNNVCDLASILYQENQHVTVL